MTARPDFNLRLRQYAPLGDPQAVIPDLGISLVSGPDGGTLTATFSTVIASSLPDDCEVAVEAWNGTAWIEGRDSRFVLLTQGADDRDRTGTVSITGVSLPVWMAQKAALAGVEPYSQGGNVEPVASSSSVHVSGSTFTWPGHAIGSNDRVKVTSRGSSKGLTTGAVYYARNTTTNTFQVSQTPTGAIKSFGSASNVHMERIRTRIINMPGHQFAKNQAISVLDANSNNLTDGSQYYVVNPTPTSIQVASKPGGLPIEFPNGDVLTVYRWLDGQRVFTNATPGKVAGDPFLEARDRGWGQDASGNDQVFHSWTNAGDSNSLAWPARVDDPTISGVSMGFQPGTSLWDMITFLTQNGWAEFATHGRTFDLFAPNTGNDYGTLGWTNVKRIGSAAQQLQITKDLTDYRTTEIVRGEGPIEQRVSVSRSPWGVLEQYVTASGVTSKSHAISYGKNDLATLSKPQKGYTVTEAAQEAAWLPILDYQRGDWVQVQVKGTWTKLRVTQWTLTKDTTGVIQASIVLEYRKRALLHRVAGAARKANGGRAAATSSTTPHESDKRKAAKPGSLTVSARTSAAADKSARGSLTATWLPVTTDGDGGDLTGAQYEVIVRADGEQTGKVVATTKGTTVELPAHPAGATIAVSVRAISSTGEHGELTDEVEYIVDLPEAVPDAPSAPTVSSTLGSMVVSWDGNLVDPTDGPHTPGVDDALAYVQVQRSLDQTTWVTEAQTLAAAGSVTDLGLVVGTTYFYRLVAVSQLGTASAVSPVASAAVVGVDTAQINATFTKQVTDAADAASSAQTIANTAQALASSKAKITYSTSPASGAGVTAGDVWYQTDGAGKVLAQWTWSGSAWQANLFAATLLAGSIAASQLAVADFTNAASGSDFENPAANPWATTTSWAVDTAQHHSGTTAFKCTGTAAPASSALGMAPQTTAGEVWYVEFWAYRDAAWNGVVANSKLRFGSQTGALVGAVTYAAADFPAATWTKRTGSITVGSGVTSLAITLSSDATAGNLWLDDIIIRRKNAGVLIVDGAIDTAQLSATAIDAMTITGATFRTASTAKTSGGVQIDSTGLHGYNASGSATFSLDTSGNLSMTGTVHATSGTIDGTLTMGSSGSVFTGSTTSGQASTKFSTSGVQYTIAGTIVGTFGRVTDSDSQVVGIGFNYLNNASYAVLGISTNSGVMRVRSTGGVVLSEWNGAQADAPGTLTLHNGLDAEINSGDITLNKYTAIPAGGVRATDLLLTDDGAPRVASLAILNRTYTQASTNPGGTGVSSTGLCVVTNSGTLGLLTGALATATVTSLNSTPAASDNVMIVQRPDGALAKFSGTMFHPAVYSDSISTRAVYVSSAGHLGTTSSSRRTKNLHRHIRMDDAALEGWLKLPTWEFDYKADPASKTQYGLVAEEVHDAGLRHLVYYDEREGDTKGQIDGLAYERFPVMNRMAIQRLFARLQQLEQQVAKMTP